MFSIYSFLSLIGLIVIFITIFSNICKYRILCIILFSLFSITWILNLGFVGTDLYRYIEAAEKYSFANPGLFSKPPPLETFTGYLTSIIKLFTGELNGESLIMINRFVIYWFLPVLTIWNAPTSKETKSTFLTILSNLILFPYTFLGAVNIFTNGIALQLFFLSIISYLNTLPSYAYKYKYKNLFNKITSFLFLFFCTFTHNIGLWILSCLIFSKIVKRFFYLLKLIPNNIRKLYISRTILFNGLPFIIIALIARRYASSQYFDLTAPITAFISLAFLVLMIDLIRRIFNLNKIIDLKSLISESTVFSQIIFFSLTLTFPSVIFSLISGNDAAERLTFTSILFTSTIIIYIGVQRNILFKFLIKKEMKLSSFIFDRSLFGCFLLLTSFTLYFYNSIAFCINIGSYGTCN